MKKKRLGIKTLFRINTHERFKTGYYKNHINVGYQNNNLHTIYLFIVTENNYMSPLNGPMIQLQFM